ADNRNQFMWLSEIALSIAIFKRLDGYSGHPNCQNRSHFRSFARPAFLRTPRYHIVVQFQTRPGFSPVPNRLIRRFETAALVAKNPLVGWRTSGRTRLQAGSLPVLQARPHKQTGGYE